VLVVELDVRQEVRLDVRDPVPWLGPHDRPRVDPNHVARPVELDGLLDVACDGSAAGHRGPGDPQGDRHAGPGCGARVGADPARDAGPEPGKDGVRAYPGTRCSVPGLMGTVPACLGSPATRSAT